MTKVKDIILVPLEPFDLECIRQLQAVTFQVGSFDKRFSRSMAVLLTNPEMPFSQKQQRWLRYMVHKYRRQIRGHKCGLWCKHPYDKFRGYDRKRTEEEYKLAEWNARVKENQE